MFDKWYYKNVIKHYTDLEVFRESYQLAIMISKKICDFPKHEQYDLGSQLRRSSRSVPTNITEGWAKREFPKLFKRHLLDLIGSCDETKVHIQFAQDLGYWETEFCAKLLKRYNILGKKLHHLTNNWQTFQT